MTVGTLNSLEDVLNQLRSRHLGTNDLALAPVCTRVMLRTGANLRAPRPEQSRDPALIAKVVATLAEMNYPL